MELSAPAQGALALALVEPTTMLVERVIAVVISASGDASERGESVLSASVDAEMSEQVPMEAAMDKAAKQVPAEDATNEATVLDGTEVVATA
ncbi:unnamed protein product [Arabis nemorensis]|uniref:Uncharacterized protein n=1 Tax=Arabis nemorensis TaxID=586526 RepID=A0A565BUD7_9BRAS|nr:unnamed protein product [Arabis nemorensis]